MGGCAPIPTPMTATSRLGRLATERALVGVAAGRRKEVARAEGDPFGLRPVRVELAHGAVELGGDVVFGRALGCEPAGLAPELLEIFAGGGDHAGVADLAMARHDDVRLEAFELLQHADPAVAVDVDLVG